MSDAFMVVMQGDKPTLLGKENFVTIHCQECGQRITEPEAANVAFTRDAQTGDRQSFEILCLGCAGRHDKKTPTSWIKLHEFIEALADSVGMKAERKSKIQRRICLWLCDPATLQPSSAWFWLQSGVTD